MSVSKSLAAALLVGSVVIGAGCTARSTDESKQDADAVVRETKADTATAVDETKAGANSAIDATKKAGSEVADASKDVARATADAAKEIAGAVARTSEDVAHETKATVTDDWVTTKVKAKFVDETVLEGSDISVHTTNHVVTLTGSVHSSAARLRAVAIAKGTEGVTRVVDKLVVKNN